MNQEINNQVKAIKQSFRQMMDGAVAQSMREKGLDYHLNWGATMLRLREKADEIGKNYDLASISICHTPLRKPIPGLPLTRNSISSAASISSHACL